MWFAYLSLFQFKGSRRRDTGSKLGIAGAGEEMYFLVRVSNTRWKDTLIPF